MTYLDKTIHVARKGVRSVIDAIYPATCLACDARVEGERALCGKCWGETPFVAGLVCDRCGVPLAGDSTGTEYCDDCQTLGRPWAKGRAALLYSGTARKMVLALKHGDQTEAIPQMARWMARAGQPVIERTDTVVPVPVHWTRAVTRRYDQSVLLSTALSAITGQTCRSDALIRARKTGSQDGKSRPERFANTEGAFVARYSMRGARVLLVDDVMTSGATFAAAADACKAAGAEEICVLALARVAKDV